MASGVRQSCFVSPNGEPLRPINLSIKVEKAVDLRNADVVGYSDPYVIVSYKQADPQLFDGELPRNTVVGRTAVIKNNLNPVWAQEEFTFSVPSLASIVKFVVMDRDKITRDDYLGTAYLRVWDHVFEDGSPEEVWLHLHNGKREAKLPPQGHLKIVVTASGLPDGVFEQVQLMGIPDEADSQRLEVLMHQYIREEFPDQADAILADDAPSSSASSCPSSSSRPRAPMLKMASLGQSEIFQSQSPSSSSSSSTGSGEQRRGSYVVMPLLTHRLVRTTSKSGKDVWVGSHVHVGQRCATAPGDDDAAATAAATAAEDDGANPWETPKTPPKKSTYTWSNWGRTIYVKERRRWTPESLADIQAAIADATAAGVKIRCVAHAHSWTPIFGDSGNDLMFLHKLNKVTKQLSGPASQWTITAQAGATNGAIVAMLRKNSLFLPTNVISTEFLAGGVLSTGSHGSGWGEGLVLDSVVQLKIVDGNGALRVFKRYTDAAWTVEDPQWKYVVLNLGMFGIVYKITYRVQKEIRHALTKDWYVTLDRFFNTDLYERVITGEHYTELFWFPFNDAMWVKTWDFTDRHPKWRPLQSMWVTFSQWAQSRIGHYVGPWIAGTLGKLTPEFGRSSFALLKAEYMGPEDKPKEHVMDIPQAIHWRKFLDAMPVWNCEVAVNLPNDPATGKPDVSAVKDLWMFVVNLTNDIADGRVTIPGLTNKYPNNVTLEARFVKNTCAYLSNAYGNDHTMFIEWVTVTYTPGWKEYSNYIMSECIRRYPDSCRSHWAKYQQDMPDWIAYNRQKYGARFDEFTAIRRQLNVDPNNIFTTSWLEAMFDIHRA